MVRGVIKSYVFPFFNRLLHLLFIACFALAYVLASTQKGFVSHAVLGVLFGALVVFRLVWGFVGARFSRFADFHFSGVWGYLRSVFSGKKPFTAHNPASSWAVVLIFALGILSTLSGLLLWGQSEQKGLFSALYFAYSPNLSSLHEFFVNALLLVACVHICGALIDKFISKNDSLNAIITGYKRTAQDEGVRLNAAQKAFCALALCALALLCVLLQTPANSLLHASTPPAFSTQKPYALYKKECGSCHIAYAPYLLPQKAWANLMGDLQNHFGDDASLDEPEFADISSFLNANVSERYETQFKANLASENISEIAISKYKFYQKAHENLPQSLFESPQIKSKANCNACHENGELGFFGKSGIDFTKISTAQKALQK